MAKKLKVGIVGMGGISHTHVPGWKASPYVELVAGCDINPAVFSPWTEKHGKIKLYGDSKDIFADPDIDIIDICTPNMCHAEQTIRALEAGKHVICEKPLAPTPADIRKMIAARDRSGKLLVVAFPGSLSPQIRKAVKLYQSGDLGQLLSISATVWQSWGPGTVGSWRQVPEISGGGFLFDTGAHMLNTVVDLAGEEFTEVAAFMDFNQRPVETEAVVIGRLKSGAMVTLHGAGESIPSCASDIYAFYSKAILRTGIWGEKLEIQRTGENQFKRVRVPRSQGVWEQFMAVRGGKMTNPCPPEVGLRMAKLYDAIKISAAQHGALVKCE